jgi:hypothetical protein
VPEKRSKNERDRMPQMLTSKIIGLAVQTRYHGGFANGAMRRGGRLSA